MTTGLPHSRASPRTSSATARCGGFERSTMTRVSGSPASSSRPRRVVRPPTTSVRSRPPVPIAWLIPLPARWTRTVTSWSPVPDPATTPIGPRRTRFAKPRATPSRIAVPAPGPIMSSRFATAACLRSRSSSTDTLSLKRRTLRPDSRALAASRAANAPATDTTATSAPPSEAAAEATLRARLAASPGRAPDGSGRDALASASSARSTAASAVSSSSASTAIIRSSGLASTSAPVNMFASASIRRLASVPIATVARATPGRSDSSVETRIRRTESW